MFKISKETNVYIGCPAQLASGGAELLHQLCHALNSKGINSYMFYNCAQQYQGDPVNERFKKYGNRYVDTIIENEKNILIVPETLIDSLKNFPAIRKCIWWLGINHYLIPTELFSHKYLRCIGHWILKLIHLRKPMTFKDIRKQEIVCWAQCWYAVSFLQRKHIHNVAYLSDYIGTNFIDAYLKHDFNISEKENIVLYNPKRNTKYIKKLMKAAPDIQFVAIENMTPDEVKAMMKKAKIYADFGSHPGKDRMPRESALQNCCILTSTLGSADFYDDVPIPSSYKFERTNANISKVVNKIRYIFSHFEEEQKNFESYIQYILQEKKNFEKDIDKLFFISAENN